MKTIVRVLSIFILLIFVNSTFADIAQINSPVFFSSIQPLSDGQLQMLRKYSWHPGCPVSPASLVAVKISYYGFDNKTHLGTLIVNKHIATEISKIFAELYQQRFPIQKIIPADYYQGDDNKIMADNDTSMFLCRYMTERPNVLSQHSYGSAIDINPLVNPTITNGTVLPPAGRNHLDRTKLSKGMITRNSSAYKIFKKYGWHWGGDWKSLKDYQHFEKLRLNKTQ